MGLAVRLILAGVLMGAALSKLASPRSSQEALLSFGLGPGLERRFAWASLIGVELVLAVGVGAGLDWAAYCAAALMGLFALLLVGAILRGQAGAPCGCFGSRSKVSWPSVARSLVLALAFAVLPSLPGGGLAA